MPLLFDREVKEVLFMCFGSGVTCGTLALSDFERIDAVEICKDVLDAAPLFTADNLGVLNRRKVVFHIDDGRNYLLTTDNTYDLITFEPMPLALAGVSTFYTQDYYQLCYDRLKPGGLVQQWIPLHSLSPQVVRSLAYTFTTVFPEYCAFFVNADLFLIGSNEPIQLDYAKAAERLAQPVLEAALYKAGFRDPAEVVAAFLLDKPALEAYVEGGEIMTDDRPWAEFAAPKLVYQRMVQDTLAEIEPYIASPLPLLIEAGAATDVLKRRHDAHRNDFHALQAYYGGMVSDDSISRDFLHSLEIDPLDTNAQYYLRSILPVQARLWIGGGRLEKAEDALTQALQIMPDDEEFRALLKQVWDAQRKAEKKKTP